MTDGAISVTKQPDLRPILAIGGALIMGLGLLVQCYEIGSGLSADAGPPHRPIHSNSKPRKENCGVRSDLPERNLTQNHSFTITVHVSLPQGAQACDSDVSILAPSLDVKPESMKFHLPDAQGKKQRDFAFNLMPKQIGPQTVVVSYERGQDSIDYEVNDEKGLSAWLSEWSGVATFVFGGIFTVPWWIDFFAKRRERTPKLQVNEFADTTEVMELGGGKYRCACGRKFTYHGSAGKWHPDTCPQCHRNISSVKIKTK